MDMKDNRNFKIATLLCLVSILITSTLYVSFKYMDLRALHSDLNLDFNSLYRAHTKLKKEALNKKKKLKEKKKAKSVSEAQA